MDLNKIWDDVGFILLFIAKLLNGYQNIFKSIKAIEGSIIRILNVIFRIFEVSQSHFWKLDKWESKRLIIYLAVIYFF